MKPFIFALLSGNSRSDVIGTFTVYADDVKKAKERIKSDPDMAGVRFYPMSEKKTDNVAAEPVAA